MPQCSNDDTETNHGRTLPRSQPNIPHYKLDDLPRNHNFTGREDALRAIADTLLLPKLPATASQVEGPRVFALCGMGGIGKTDTAIAFAYRHRDDFDVILWAHAGSRDALETSLWHMLLQLGLRDQSNDCRSEANKETIWSWLSDPWKLATELESDLEAAPLQRSRATWLLVLDGADNPLVLQDFRSLDCGAILITSRDPSAKTILSKKPAGLDLGRLQKHEGTSLLKKLTNETDYDDTAAENLVEILGGLPLAIFQMATISVSRKLSLREMYKLYNRPNQHANLHTASVEPTTYAYPHNLATVWKLETLGPGAKTILDTFSFLDPNKIQERLFDKIYHDIGVLSVPKGPASFNEARDELMRSSLVKRDQEGIDLTIHGVVQDVAIAKLESNKFDSLFCFTVFLIWYRWPSATPGSSLRKPDLHPKTCNQRDIVSRWPWCASLYPHVLRLKYMWELTKAIPDITKIRLCALLNNAAWYQHERGSRQDLDELLKTSNEISETIKDPRKTLLMIDIHFFLGAIAADMNQHKVSREHKCISYRMQFDMLKPHGRVGERAILSVIELAVAAIQDGQFNEAINMLLSAQRERKKLSMNRALACPNIEGNILRTQAGNTDLSTYLPSELESYLGFAYMMQGRLIESEAILSEALGLRRQILGEPDDESYRTGLLLFALGNLRSYQGQYRMDGSHYFHLKAYSHYKSSVGITDHRTADAGYKIAQHQLREGNYEKALELLKQSIEVWHAWPEVYKPELARASFLQSAILSSMGDKAQAITAEAKAYKLRKTYLREQGKPKPRGKMMMKDLDDLVMFWSR